jgi:hypothetical protein
MELSEEMKEAIRILREDGQIASYNQLTTSHKEVIERLDHIENGYSEYRAAQEEKKTDPPKQEESGTSGDPSANPPANPGGPEPPPVKQEETNPPKKGRQAWWERGGYAGD